VRRQCAFVTAITGPITRPRLLNVTAHSSVSPSPSNHEQRHDCSHAVGHELADLSSPLAVLCVSVPVVRATVLAVGSCATALIALAAFLLFIGTLYAHKEVIGVLLTAGAIAGPLFGTIAGSHQERWNPLLAGCAIGLFFLVVLFGVP
jgi:hypothetical protein